MLFQHHAPDEMYHMMCHDAKRCSFVFRGPYGAKCRYLLQAFPHFHAKRVLAFGMLLLGRAVMLLSSEGFRLRVVLQ